MTSIRDFYRKATILSTDENNHLKIAHNLCELLMNIDNISKTCAKLVNKMIKWLDDDIVDMMLNNYKLPIKIICNTDLHKILTSHDNFIEFIDQHNDKHLFFKYEIKFFNYYTVSILRYSVEYQKYKLFKYLLENGVYFLDEDCPDIMNSNIFNWYGDLCGNLIHYDFDPKGHGDDYTEFDLHENKTLAIINEHKEFIKNHTVFINSLRYTWIYSLKYSVFPFEM